VDFLSAVLVIKFPGVFSGLAAIADKMTNIENMFSSHYFWIY